MKKVFSILLAMVVLLSSLHFTVATHLCGGKLAAVKVGLEGTMASCGMQSNNSCPTHSGISSEDCCKNSSRVLVVDNYKTTPSFELQKIDLKLLQAIIIPVLHIFQVSPSNSISYADEGHFHSLMSLPGRLAFICVFRK